jgi:hypothetical protein
MEEMGVGVAKRISETETSRAVTERGRSEKRWRRIDGN